MATVTLRLDDETRDRIEWLARSQETTVSDLLRDAINGLLGRSAPTERPGHGPRSLSFVERRILTQQHQILRLLEAGDKHQTDYHDDMITVLERGFTGEYDDEFRALETELPGRECELVRRIFDMFRVIKATLDRLSDEDIAMVGGEQAVRALTFDGFDFQEPRESRLAGYGEYLVGTGRWSELAAHFDEEHDGGNSHHANLGPYLRMLEVFDSIWQRKLADHSNFFAEDRYLLSVDELKKLYAAWPYPRE